MTSVRRNETCRVKKERVLMDAYQLLNGDDDKTCACPADNNRARPTEKWVFFCDKLFSIDNIDNYIVVYTDVDGDAKLGARAVPPIPFGPARERETIIKSRRSAAAPQFKYIAIIKLQRRYNLFNLINYYLVVFLFSFAFLTKYVIHIHKNTTNHPVR